MREEVCDFGRFAPRGPARELCDALLVAVREIDSYRPLSADVAKRISDEATYDRVHSSAATEGNKLTRRETIAVLTHGIVTAGASHDVEEVMNLAKAVLRVQDFLVEGVVLDGAAVRELNRIVLGNTVAGGGQWRAHGVAISGAIRQPPPGGDVPELVRDVFTASASNPSLSAVERAVWLHWAMARIHPFVDGNGRVARLVQDHTLLAANLVPSALRSEDRDDGNYYKALESADAGDGQPLLEMTVRNALHMTDKYLAILREGTERSAWVASIAKKAQLNVKNLAHGRLLTLQRAANSIRAEFQNLSRELAQEGVPATVRVRGYDPIDVEKFAVLERTGRTARTWLFGVEVGFDEVRLRYVFWAGIHFRLDDGDLDVPTRVVIKVSQEDEFGVYQALEEVEEDRISLREVVPVGSALWRRRYDPVAQQYCWDRPVLPSQIARDFLEEALSKIGLL